MTVRAHLSYLGRCLVTDPTVHVAFLGLVFLRYGYLLRNLVDWLVSFTA